MEGYWLRERDEVGTGRYRDDFGMSVRLREMNIWDGHAFWTALGCEKRGMRVRLYDISKERLGI